MTSNVASKVERIKWELGLDPATPIGAAVLHANQTMRLEPLGTLPEQVDCLLIEMGIAVRSDNISLPGAPAGLGALSSASPQSSPHGESAQPNRNSRRTYPVSYTHLTLPTIRLV